MDKTLHIRPRMSEKTYGMSQNGVYVFDVPRNANKHAIARAVATQFEVTVLDVNIANIKGKAKRTIRKGSRPIAGQRTGIKKAFVTLKQGDKLPFFQAVEEEEKKQAEVQAKAAKAAEKAAKKADKEAAKKEEK